MSDFMMADPKFVKDSQKQCRQQNSCACEALAGAYMAQPDLEAARVYADLACAQGSSPACVLIEELDHRAPEGPPPAPFAGSESYMDRFGNEWVEGPHHGDTSLPFTREWDVQLNPGGQGPWQEIAGRNGYINVRPDGQLSHR